MTNSERKWKEKYGNLPEEQDELIELIKNIKKIDYDKYLKEKQRIENIEWKKIEFDLPLLPSVTPRARYSSVNNTFYVKGAAENKKIIKKLIKYSEIISTVTKFCVDCYFPTPISILKGYEILLAEEKKILPMITKDWDNLGKTYSDMIQGYLIVNDNIICDGRVRKFFSIRPHVFITIEYQSEYDSDYNKKRVESSKSYKKCFNKIT